MPPVTQTIPSLIGGVSEAPPELRDPSSVSDATNLVASPQRGLVSRPPSRFVALLGLPDAELENAHEHTIEFSETEKYVLVLADGVCRLFDALTGAEQSVTLAAGVAAYLEGAGAGTSVFDALTVGKETLVLNRAKTVALGAEVAPSRSPDALIFVRAGDFSTTYSFSVNGTPASHTTPDGTDPAKRGLIGTDYIAEQLEAAFRSRGISSQFTVARSGNVIYLRRIDGQDFTLTASDGLGGEAVLVLKGSTASEDSLPTELPDEAEGFTIEVRGSSAARNREGSYWLRSLSGRWTEVSAPGVRVALDGTTLPHMLKRGASVIERLENAGGPTPGSSLAPTAGGASLLWDNPSVAEIDVSEIFPATVVTSLPSSLYDGNPFRTTIRYRLDTSEMPSGGTASLSFASSPDGTTWTTRGTATFPAGVSGPVLWFDYVGSLPAGTRWRATLTPVYPPGTEPTAIGLTFVRAYVYQTVNGAPGIELSSVGSRIFALPPTEVYPPGAIVGATVQGTPVTYTVPSTGVTTGADIATQLLAAINAAAITNITAVAGVPGQVLIKLSTGSEPTVVPTLVFDDENVLFNPELALTPGALAGLIVESIADGSTATISANTATTVTVSGWSGVSSEFRPLQPYRVRYSNASWSLAPAVWEKREAGDEETAASPGFVGRVITGMFVYQNRLGFLCADGFVMSSAKSFFRFFRESSRQVLDADVIDVRSRARPGEVFYHAFAFNDSFYLSTERTQFRLYGSPMLTPRTVGLDVVSEYPVSPRCKPAVVGTRLYLAAQLSGATQVVEMFATDRNTLVGDPLTSALPRYLLGAPVALVGNGTLGQLILITEVPVVGRMVWSLNVAYGDGGRVQSAFGAWEFGGLSEAVNVAIVGQSAAFVVNRDGVGFTLERMDLLEGAVSDFRMLDCQMELAGSVSGGSTAWTLPFSGAGVVTVVTPSGAALTLSPVGDELTAPAEYAGTASVGYTYASEVELSPLLYRTREGTVETRGRLKLSVVRVQLDRTASISSLLETPGRSSVVRSSTGPATGRREFRIPVQSNADGATITLSSSLRPMRIASLDWDGEFTPRTSRV